jgi:iron complex outermembrane receptor protein
MRKATKMSHRHDSQAGKLPQSVKSPLCAIAFMALVAPPVVLAETASGPAAQDDGAKLDEVVVTARRRDESLEKVPIAVSAISAEQLGERQVRTDSDLQLSVPGLTIRQTQGNNSLTYSIRGQTADTFSGSPSAVVTYLNEVPLTIGGASTFFDLESVQVLKGPQGTLFGRNATGGAVLYSSAKPKNATEGLLRARVGNLDLREIEGMFNTPIVQDKVLLRGAINVIKRDGYIHNLLDDSYLGETDRKSGRLSLTILPTDNLENTTVAQVSRTDGTNTGASYTYSVYQCGDTNNGVSLTCGSGFLFGPGLDDAYQTPGLWDQYLATHPEAYTAGLAAYVEEQKRMGPYKTRHPGEADHHGRDWMVTNTTSYDFSDTMRLKNILGASHTETDSEQPQLGAPFITILTANLDTGESGNELDVDSLSEELQLHGSAIDGALTYIVGAYYQKTETDTLWPQTYFYMRPLDLQGVNSAVTNAFRLRNETKAIYAQSNYDLDGLTGVKGLSVTTGVRQTWEHVEIEQLPEATYTASAADQERSFKDPSWELGLEYQVTDDVLTYLKHRGSFRSGGFNGAAPPVNSDATGGGNMFDSEHVRDVEAGVKFRGLVADRPAALNIAIYKQWIKDVQRVEFPDPDGAGGLASIAVTANVPEAEVKGFEVEASLLAASWLEVGISMAFTDAVFTDSEVDLFGTSYSYGPFGDTPKRSGSAFAQIYFPTDEALGPISFRTEMYAQSEQYFSNAADSVAPDTQLPGYGLLNARLSWNEIMHSDFSAALFGKNLDDREYFTGGMTLAAALGHNAAAVGEPRTYGLELTYQLD